MTLLLEAAHSLQRFKLITSTKKLICILAIFQILILTTSIVANPYLINEAENSDSNASISNKTKDITKKAIILLGMMLSIKQIGTVSASSVGCCEELKSGAICEDMVSDNANLCKTSLLSTTCDQTDKCKLGCCVDSESGSCDSKTTKGKCEENDGEWDSSSTCDIEKCKKGCCILGDEDMQFINEKECEVTSALYGYEKDFRASTSELACLNILESKEKGACLYNDEECKYTTKDSCTNLIGTFYESHLCSESSLETNCTKQASIGCVDGKDEIYWFDSCGNRENIYNSDKTASWNNGKILSKGKSCNPNSSNIDSTTCGNCNRALGSVCASSTDPKVKDGDYICKSLKCTDAEGKTRENGESWCIYDSYIGDGKDTVGSEHWRAYCSNGKIEVDLCGDYRGKICVQSEMKSSGKEFSIASCVTNTAFECINFNKEKDKTVMAENCNKSEYCMVKNVAIDNLQFSFCVGKYPKGFNVSASSTNQAICSVAGVSCTVVYKKGLFSGWSCSDNCNCETEQFSNAMNDFCVSLGDCGTYVNYIGKGTNNTKITGAPANNWKNYVNYSKPVKGQYANSSSLKATLELLLGSIPIDMSGEEAAAEAIKKMETISGAVGTLAWAANSLGYTGGLLASSSTGTATLMGAVSSCAAGAAIGMMVGSWLADSQGITGTPAVIMAVAGAVVGIVAGLAWVKGIALVPGYGWVAAIIAIVIIIIISILGWGKTETRTVTFQCLPWEAPTGGDDCSKCQEDSEKTCTEYRCKSLGQACVLLNPEKEFPECKSLPKETIAPTIFIVNASEGYKFEDIEKNGATFLGESKECIQEFTLVNFTLGTNESAQCIASFTLPNSKTFDSMNNSFYPVEGNSFTINHTFGINMPSLDSLSEYDILGDLKEKYANMHMYVRCKDYWGNYNIDEYIINFCVNDGPDLTPVSSITPVPASKTTLLYGEKEKNVSFYLNEPAECKYSNSSEVEYKNMNYSMTCKTNISEYTSMGWQCQMIMNLSNEENKIYVRCEDQPWLKGTANESNRNSNQEDYEYVLYVSGSELNITSISPNGSLERGTGYNSVKLEVETKGGAYDGISTCYFGNNYGTVFSETYSAVHTHNLTIMNGMYNIPIKCQDEVGNTAKSQINFTIDYQTSAPIAVRTYAQGSNIVLITNKNAECYYNLETCSFDITNGTSMTTGLSTIHTAPWNIGKIYYIKCRDIWGNTNSGCAIEVRGTQSL